MATLVLRTVKGSPLTNSEVDGNFSNINTEVGVVFDTANTINSNVGVLANLATTAKSNLVSAINELATESSSSVAITGGAIANVSLSNISVSGITGILASEITGLTTANVTELSNLYFTNARVLANITAAGFYDTVSNTSPIGASESGTTLTLSHLNSGVAAATYGNATTIPIITVNATGHVTSVSNVTVSGTSGGGGSGLFNTGITSSQATAVDIAESNVFAAASTTDKRYIIHSIHVTNIDGNYSPSVTSYIQGSNYSSISLGNTIPIPGGSSVELLKKPKVLQPSEYIRISSNVNYALHATATIEEVNGTSYFGKGIDITASETYQDLHDASGACVIESILLSNDDINGLDVKATVIWADSGNNIEGYYAYEMVIPSGSTVEILEQPKYLADTKKIRVKSNQADRLEAIIAGKVI